MEEGPFQPQINKKSQGIERDFNSIHQDTSRRMQQKQQYDKLMSKKPRVAANQINSASDKVINDKFDQDFKLTSVELGLIGANQAQNIDNLNKFQVTCSQLSQIFLVMGFVSPVAQEEEQLMLADIWSQLGGDREGQGVVSLGSCKNFLRAI
mmetsp:Transcript_5313/g.8949  ORF Transcript_5313/g.8949 Transcript_5313/m.8949 type:complete len:152 (+) Transcript_5313:929-1384(+)